MFGARLELAISRLLRRALLQQPSQLGALLDSKFDLFDNRILEGILVDDELVEGGLDLGESDQFGARARWVGGSFAGGGGGGGADQVGHDRDEERPRRGGGCEGSAGQRVRDGAEGRGGQSSRPTV